VDHRLRVGINFLAQVRDVQIDDAPAPLELLVPDSVQDLGARQCPARIAHQEAQQLKLG
jgi:hypothetical protein